MLKWQVTLYILIAYIFGCLGALKLMLKYGVRAILLVQVK